LRHLRPIRWAILTPESMLSTMASASPVRPDGRSLQLRDNSGHAAHRYSNIDHNVSTVATYSNTKPASYTGSPAKASGSMSSTMAIICETVFIFPR